MAGANDGLSIDRGGRPFALNRTANNRLSELEIDVRSGGAGGIARISRAAGRPPYGIMVAPFFIDQATRRRKVATARRHLRHPRSAPAATARRPDHRRLVRAASRDCKAGRRDRCRRGFEGLCRARRDLDEHGSLSPQDSLCPHRRATAVGAGQADQFRLAGSGRSPRRQLTPCGRRRSGNLVEQRLQFRVDRRGRIPDEAKQRPLIVADQPVTADAVGNPARLLGMHCGCAGHLCRAGAVAVRELLLEPVRLVVGVEDAARRRRKPCGRRSRQCRRRHSRRRLRGAMPRRGSAARSPMRSARNWRSP